jgi:hypothetical protein
MVSKLFLWETEIIKARGIALIFADAAESLTQVPQTPSPFICTHNKMLSIAPVSITNSDSALMRIHG